MVSAKDIFIKPINSRTANALIKKIHYSGKVAPNSQLHFGVFLKGRLEGALQFGPSMDKKKTQKLVSETGFNEFIELNRMAFSDSLPRFSESRAIGYCLRFIKTKYPQIKWVISFSDGTQCGDGTIYRASGFCLTGIKDNTGQRIDDATGEVFSQITFSAHRPNEKSYFKTLRKLEGKQLRYVYFIDKSYRERLTVPILPFSDIDKKGAGMYKGKAISIQDRKRSTKANSGDQLESGGAIPTTTLQPKESIEELKQERES